ncbi:MAG: hypothetical protein U9Q74_05095, partial [Gemmatimonadota bacterium]|nr:hypothetical protein [Gemmatimonadota bacterium]
MAVPAVVNVPDIESVPADPLLLVEKAPLETASGTSGGSRVMNVVIDDVHVVPVTLVLTISNGIPLEFTRMEMGRPCEVVPVQPPASWADADPPGAVG